jgi:hypothetical protein
MLTVEIDRIVPTPSDLRFGLVIRYGENGPVRFAQVRLGDEHLTWEVLTALMEYVTTRVNRHLDAERECGEPQEALFDV